MTVEEAFGASEALQNELLVVMFSDPCTQLYVPAFYILLTARNEKMYLRSLRAVIDILDVKPDVATMTCDFEHSLRKAVKGF
jgi:hypothetical protein